VNRIGWPKEILDLDHAKPKPTRGTFKMAYCNGANIAAFQWCDSKVVNCVSSYCNFGVSTIYRQVGAERLSVPCPSAMVHYQQHMGGVDKMDQMRSHFGGFASQSHFKKWYKKSLMAILDCMLLNALNLWNMSAKKVAGREEICRYKFIHCIAEELLRYETPRLCSPQQPPTKKRGRQQEGGQENETIQDEEDTGQSAELMDHQCPGPDDVVKTKGGSKRCLVCGLEVHFYAREVRNERKLRGNVESAATQMTRKRPRYEGLRKSVYTCKICGISAHFTGLHAEEKRTIHNLFPPGDATSCMAIAHSKTGKEVWNVSIDEQGGKRISVRKNHPIVKEMKRCVEASLASAGAESAITL
jgi:Transposase IS4